MLYPSFGPSKPDSIIPKNTAIFRALGTNGMALYKLIFDNNKQKLVEEFF